MLDIKRGDLLLRLESQLLLFGKDEVPQLLAGADDGPLLGGGIVEESLRVDSAVSPNVMSCSTVKAASLRVVGPRM